MPVLFLSVQEQAWALQLQTLRQELVSLWGVAAGSLPRALFRLFLGACISFSQRPFSLLSRKDHSCSEITSLAGHPWIRPSKRRRSTTRKKAESTSWINVCLLPAMVEKTKTVALVRWTRFVWGEKEIMAFCGEKKGSLKVWELRKPSRAGEAAPTRGSDQGDFKASRSSTSS